MTRASLPIPIARDELVAVCQKFGVAKLSLFGSSLREDFDPTRSDVDLLVEFAPETRIGLFKLLEMEQSLSVMFGRKVDLTTLGSLSESFLSEVQATSQVLYDAA
jgi:predicted nucleotidyltransferase